MSTRIVAIVSVVAVGFGLTAAVLLGIVYNNAIAEPSERSAGVWIETTLAPAVAPTTPAPAVAPTTPATQATALPLPTEADIPADWPADERANALSWIAMQGFVDDCMADAGFAEYSYHAYWQVHPDGTMHGTEAAYPWMDAYPEEKKLAATLALWGDTAGGADYRWEEAGCAGYGTHMIGADGAN